jgi:hypothetical protein
MRMVSIAVEQRIIEMLESGSHTVSQIASETGVHRKTVYNIAKHGKIRDRRQCDMETVDSVPQYEKLRKPRRCPVCHGLIDQWPCVLCSPVKEIDTSPEMYDMFTDSAIISEAVAITEIITDLAELERLNLICNPLFVHLASRAIECLNRLKEKSDES